MAGAELVVGVPADSNSRSRKRDSEVGGRITFAGAGGSFGQAIGVTGGEVVAQPEVASAQVSHNSIRDGLGRSSIFFMLGSDGGQGFGLLVFGGAGLVDLVLDCLGSVSPLIRFHAISTVTTPRPAGAEHGCRPQRRTQQRNHGPIHGAPPLGLLPMLKK